MCRLLEESCTNEAAKPKRVQSTTTRHYAYIHAIEWQSSGTQEMSKKGNKAHALAACKNRLFIQISRATIWWREKQQPHRKYTLDMEEKRKSHN